MKIFKRKNDISNSKISEGIPRNTVSFPDGHAETRYVEVDVKNDIVTLTDKNYHNFASMSAYGYSANEIANMIAECDNIYKAATHFENTAVLNPFQKDTSIDNVQNSTRGKLPNLEAPKGPQQITPKPNFNFKPVNKHNMDNANKITENTPLVFKCYDPQDNHLYKEKRTIQETKKYIVSHWLDHTESNIGDGEFESAIGWMEDATAILKMEPADFLENVLKNNTYNYQPVEDIGLTYFDVFEPTLKVEQIGNSHLELTDKNGELMTFPIEKLEKAGVTVEQVKEIVATNETLSEAYFEIVDGKEELANLVDLSSNSQNLSKTSHDDIEPDL